MSCARCRTWPFSLERSAVLKHVGQVAAELIGSDLGFIGLLNGGNYLQLTEVHGGETDALERVRVEKGLGLGGKVLSLGVPAQVEDYCSAESISHEYDEEIAEEGLRGVLCLPLVVSDELLGAVYVSDRTPKVYSDVMVDRVVTAVEGAKLALSMADRSRELTEAAVEMERQRTVEVLDASMRSHLSEILQTAKAIAHDPTSPDDLVDRARSIVDTASNASTLFCMSARELWDGESTGAKASVDHDFGLSPRELEVVRSAARGLSNPEIAEELFLARGTVKAYMEVALRKLEARNRVEAVMIAARAGLLDAA